MGIQQMMFGGANAIPNGGEVWQVFTGDFQSVYARIGFNSDGTTLRNNSIGEFFLTDPILNWYTPTTSNIGSSYWIKATIMSSTGTGTFDGSTATFGQVISLSSNPVYSIYRTVVGFYELNLRFEFFSDSLGNNLVGTASGCILNAERLQ